MLKVKLDFNEFKDPVYTTHVFRDENTGHIMGWVLGRFIKFCKDISGNIYATQDLQGKTIVSKALDDYEYNNLKKLLKAFDNTLKSTEKNLITGKEKVYLIKFDLDDCPYFINSEYEMSAPNNNLFKKVILNAYNKVFKTNIPFDKFNEFMLEVGKKMKEKNIAKDIISGPISHLPKINL